MENSKECKFTIAQWIEIAKALEIISEYLYGYLTNNEKLHYRVKFYKEIKIIPKKKKLKLIEGIDNLIITTSEFSQYLEQLQRLERLLIKIGMPKNYTREALLLSPLPPEKYFINGNESYIELQNYITDSYNDELKNTEVNINYLSKDEWFEIKEIMNIFYRILSEYWNNNNKLVNIHTELYGYSYQYFELDLNNYKSYMYCLIELQNYLITLGLPKEYIMKISREEFNNSLIEYFGFLSKEEEEKD